MQRSIPMSLSESSFSEIDELNGFPISTRSFSNGCLTNESTFQSSRREAIDPAECEPPSGYKRQTMGLLPGRQ